MRCADRPVTEQKNRRPGGRSRAVPAATSSPRARTGVTRTICWQFAWSGKTCPAGIARLAGVSGIFGRIAHAGI